MEGGLIVTLTTLAMIVGVACLAISLTDSVTDPMPMTAVWSRMAIAAGRTRTGVEQGIHRLRKMQKALEIRAFCDRERRRADLNRRMRVLQTSSLAPRRKRKLRGRDFPMRARE
jgi:hypothetical protein